MTPSRFSLNILHLASSERWTGAAEPVASLARQQMRLGHRVWLACVPGRSFARKARERGLALADGFHLNRRLNPFHLIADLKLLARFCRENRIDIVHCHLLHDHWLAATALKGLRARQNGLPLLVRTIHAGAPPRSDWMHRRLFLERTDQFVCVAADAARRAELALRLPAGSVAYVRGGVDLDRFRPGLDGSALRSELGIPMDAPVAGVVARMRVDRGLRWLIQAIPAVLEQVPSAHFLVAGRGELKHWFKREIRDPAYRGQVKYAGHRREDLPLAYAAMDVLLFLGLGSEGTCRALLEAMACARPTIGAHKAAVPEIIDNKKTGLLVRDHDVKDLSDKLVEMLGDRDKCARMGEAARARAETLFDEAARARAFDAIYRSLMEKKGLLTNSGA